MIFYYDYSLPWYYNVSLSSVFLIINYFILFAKLGVNELELRFSFPRFRDLFSSSSSRGVVVVVVVFVFVDVVLVRSKRRRS